MKPMTLRDASVTHIDNHHVQIQLEFADPDNAEKHHYEYFVFKTGPKGTSFLSYAKALLIRATKFLT